MKYSVREAAELTKISESTLRFYMKKFPRLFDHLERGKYKRIILTDREIEVFLKIRTLTKQQNLSVEEIEAIIISNSERITINKVDESSSVPAHTAESTETALLGLVGAVAELKDELYRQNSVLERFEKIAADLDVRNSELLEQNRMLIQKIEELNIPKEPEKPRGIFEILIERFLSWLHEGS